MTFIRKIIPLMILGMICFPVLSVQAEEGSSKSGAELNNKAEMQLDQMARKLAGAKQFSVTMNMSYDVVQESGQQIQFSEVRKVKISRPNHFRVDGQQSDGDTTGLVFDGKVLTLFHTTENVYSQTEQTGDVNAALRYAIGKLGIRVPLARLLVTTLPQELKKLNMNVDYVEHNTLGDMPTDHIAIQAKDVDYQIWIRKDLLLARIVLTYKNEPGQPQFQADFSDWNMTSAIKNSVFTYIPAKGAEKIKTLVPDRQSKVVSKVEGGEK